MRVNAKGMCAGMLIGFLAGTSVFGAEEYREVPKQVKQAVRRAELVLEEIDRDVKAGQFETIQPKLHEYRSLVDEMLGEVQNYLQVHKKIPSQFKDSEIKVRRQIRRLQDLRVGLPLSLRADLDAAVASANKLRAKFIGELFDVKPASKPKAGAKKKS